MRERDKKREEKAIEKRINEARKAEARVAAKMMDKDEYDQEIVESSTQNVKEINLLTLP